MCINEMRMSLIGARLILPTILNNIEKMGVMDALNFGEHFCNQVKSQQRSHLPMNDVCVIGLGYVGLRIAALLASLASMSKAWILPILLSRGLQNLARENT